LIYEKIYSILYEELDLKKGVKAMQKLFVKAKKYYDYLLIGLAILAILYSFIIVIDTLFFK